MTLEQIKRVIVIVLDGVGVGEAPDADEYGDSGSNSVGNTARKLGGIDLPNMQKLGFGNIIPIEGVAPTEASGVAWGKLTPKSAGKDSVTGHWELMGVHLAQAFPTYPHGFPDDIVQRIEQAAGVKFIGNVVASGTVIIQELGAEHMRTGKPILYTSADSVFQIAAHEDVIPVDELYAICETARDLLTGMHNVGRVIARPFVGSEAEGFTRTDNRHDYAVTPPTQTVLDSLLDADKEVVAVGKIKDLFGGRGISKHYHAKSNRDSLAQLGIALQEQTEGIIFANLVEFDQTYGHRNNYAGYANALADFDAYLPTLQAQMRDSDVMIISADHGVDPTTDSTDHSREYVPLLVYSPVLTTGVDLGTRESLADVGATIADLLDLPAPPIGTSFAGALG